MFSPLKWAFCCKASDASTECASIRQCRALGGGLKPRRERACGLLQDLLGTGQTLAEIFGHVNRVSVADDRESCHVVIRIEYILAVMRRMHEAPVYVCYARSETD